jgi:hypothetical protein
VLVPFPLDLPVWLTCDVSEIGAGAVLSHFMPNGEAHPVSYASRTFTQADCGYEQVEREAAAISFEITKF